MKGVADNACPKEKKTKTGRRRGGRRVVEGNGKVPVERRCWEELGEDMFIR